MTAEDARHHSYAYDLAVQRCKDDSLSADTWLPMAIMRDAYKELAEQIETDGE